MMLTPAYKRFLTQCNNADVYEYKCTRSQLQDLVFSFVTMYDVIDSPMVGVGRGSSRYIAALDDEDAHLRAALTYEVLTEEECRVCILLPLSVPARGLICYEWRQTDVKRFDGKGCVVPFTDSKNRWGICWTELVSPFDLPSQFGRTQVSSQGPSNPVLVITVMAAIAVLIYLGVS